MASTKVDLMAGYLSRGIKPRVWEVTSHFSGMASALMALPK